MSPQSGLTVGFIPQQHCQCTDSGKFLQNFLHSAVWDLNYHFYHLNLTLVKEVIWQKLVPTVHMNSAFVVSDFSFVFSYTLFHLILVGVRWNLHTLDDCLFLCWKMISTPEHLLSHCRNLAINFELENQNGENLTVRSGVQHILSMKQRKKSSTIYFISLLIDWLAFGFQPVRSWCTYALTNGPFVPHDLIPPQGSPVPLPMFQMAHRFISLTQFKIWKIPRSSSMTSHNSVHTHQHFFS